MADSPRIRRLRSDFRAMERLRAESTIIDFDFRGDPPDDYIVTFRGLGVAPSANGRDVIVSEFHRVKIHLSAAYPRMIPDMAWQTPIFHPNISASGVVCLGGYSTHWAPSLTLDELCVMLWDMIRFKNFDTESPYNRDAAIWARAELMEFPVDERPLRDRISGDALLTADAKPPASSSGIGANSSSDGDVQFIDAEIVDAEMIEFVGDENVKQDRDDEGDIIFID